MKAIVQRTTGGADVLQMEEVAKPRARARDVVVRISACGVCFHDIVVRSGTMKAGVEMPLIPGHEIAGVVEEVGSEVTSVKPGDRVATTQRYHVCGMCRFCRGGLEPLCPERRFLGDHGMVGGYAEYVAVEEDNVVRIPDAVGDEQAAIAACSIGTALNAVRDVGRVTIGDRVLVSGAGGGVGVHAVQLARLAGGYVIAQTTSADKADMLESLGAHAVLVTARGEDFSKRVKALTSGEGADVLLDHVGTVAFDAMRRSLGVNGRWVLIGYAPATSCLSIRPSCSYATDSMLSVHSTTRASARDRAGPDCRADRSGRRHLPAGRTRTPGAHLVRRVSSGRQWSAAAHAAMNGEQPRGAEDDRTKTSPHTVLATQRRWFPSSSGAAGVREARARGSSGCAPPWPNADWSRALTQSDKIYILEDGHSAERPRLHRVSSPQDQHPLFWEFGDVAADGRPRRRRRRTKREIPPRETELEGGTRYTAVQVASGCTWPAAHGRYSPVTIGIYIDGCTGRRKPLTFIRGSHNGPLYSEYDADGNVVVAIKDDELAWVEPGMLERATGGPGTVVLELWACVTVYLRTGRNAGARCYTVYSSADSFPHPSAATQSSPGRPGACVPAFRFAQSFDSRPCELPPDFRGGYKPPWMLQKKNEDFRTRRWSSTTSP